MAEWLGITLGDPSGIGPEVTLKALAAAPDSRLRYFLRGDVGTLQRVHAQVGTQLPLRAVKGSSAAPLRPRNLRWLRWWRGPGGLCGVNCVGSLLPP